jgi:ADP-ribosyl-[dinitrogen reductase] hydrolase
MTKSEAKIRAPNTLYKYFEDIDNGKLPAVDKHIGHLKIAFMWAFHYLKIESSYEAALKDILMKGRDTDTNAAIVGGLLGAFHTIDGIKLEWIEKVLSFTPDKAERHK